MAKKSNVIVQLDPVDRARTEVYFTGYMARNKFMSRVEYLKSNGFRYSKNNNVWTKKGDYVDQTEIDLNNLDAINAAKKAAPEKVTAPEPVNMAAYEDAWQNIIKALDVLTTFTHWTISGNSTGI